MEIVPAGSISHAYPTWSLNRDKAWDLWKSRGFPVSQYPWGIMVMEVPYKYHVHFKAESGGFAANLAYQTLGTEFYDMANELCPGIPVEYVSYILQQYEYNQVLALTDEQAAETGLFDGHDYYRVQYTCPNGWLNGCMELVAIGNCDYIYPTWQLNLDCAWNLWEAINFEYTKYLTYKEERQDIVNTITIAHNYCIRCKLCFLIAPDHIWVNEYVDDIIYFKEDATEPPPRLVKFDVPPDKVEYMQTAIDNCPTKALTWITPGV